MTELRKLKGVISLVNSSNVTLAANGTFTGTVEDIRDYGGISVAVYSDVASATDGLSIEQSVDGSNWDHCDTFTIPADTSKNFTIQRIARYFRMVYTNGTTIQAAFRLSVIYNQFYVKSSSHRLRDDITSEDDATLTTSLLKVIGSDPYTYHTIDVQHPLPTDGDSVYLKDIDVDNSDNGGFSGVITDYFDSLKTVNYDASATNPKYVKIWFRRSLQLNSIAFGCDDGTKTFSNIKIKILGSNEEVRYTKDLSTDDTKYNTLRVKLAPEALNGIIIEFHTADEVGLSNLVVWKATDVNARIDAVSELSGDVEDIQSFRKAINVNQALVHKVGIKNKFHRLNGVSTTTTSAIAIDDISFSLASVAGLSLGDVLHIETGTLTGELFITITAINALVITGDQPFDQNVLSGVAVDKVVFDMTSLVGTLASPIVYSIHPPAGAIWQITRLMIALTDGAAMDDGRFGGIPALDNGLLLREYTLGTVTNDEIWKTNGDIALSMYDVTYSDKAPAGENGLRGRWTFTKAEFIVELDGDNNDHLDIYVQDDITANSSLIINAQGRLFGG